MFKFLAFQMFHNFKVAHRVSSWFRRRFTPAGMLVMGALVAGGVFGIDTRETFAYQIFTLAFALLLIAMLSAWFFRAKLSMQRHLPLFGSVDNPVRYQITLHNHGKTRQQNLSLHEVLHTKPLDFAQFRRLRSQQRDNKSTTPKKSGNWFDNIVGYPQWLALLHHQRGASHRLIPLEPIPAQNSIQISIELQPLRRGYIELDTLNISCPDPLGLFRAIHVLSTPERILILPKRYPIADLNLSGKRSYQAGGVNLAMSVGDAMEFVSLREYRAGDSLQHIHWKSWAKRGVPIVKEYQDEFFVRHALVLDTFCAPSPRFEAAVSVAASCVYNLTQQDSLLDLMLVGSEAYQFTSGRGVASIDTMLEVLACVETSPEYQIKTMSALLQQHIGCLSACICVLQEWDEAREALVKKLKMSGVPVRILLIQEGLDSVPTAYRSLCRAIRPQHIATDLINL